MSTDADRLNWLATAASGQLAIDSPTGSEPRFRWYGHDGTTIRANNLRELIDTARGITTPAHLYPLSPTSKEQT